MLKFFSALAILILALTLQFTLVFIGLHFVISLAVLIAFAFALDDFWELLIFDLIAVFLLNWQPAPSTSLIAFALIPLIAFAFRKFAHSEIWIGSIIAIIIGYFLFYIASAPTLFFHYYLLQFFEDLAVGLMIGELVLVGMG